MANGAFKSNSHLFGRRASWNRGFYDGMCKYVGPVDTTASDAVSMVRKFCRVYRIAANTWKAEATHLEGKGPSTLEKLRAVFKLNEANKDDFILANFVQGTLVGDPEAMVGHFSMVGAYDAGTDRALILDVDREYMEPYWVKLSLLVDAMATQDKDSQNWRGYVRIFKNTK